MSASTPAREMFAHKENTKTSWKAHQAGIQNPFPNHVLLIYILFHNLKTKVSGRGCMQTSRHGYLALITLTRPCPRATPYHQPCFAPLVLWSACLWWALELLLVWLEGGGMHECVLKLGYYTNTTFYIHFSACLCLWPFAPPECGSQTGTCFSSKDWKCICPHNPKLS